jgi:hypothetical protein
MQIVQVPPLPPPTQASAPQALINVLPQVQAQAVAPISAQAVTPATKEEKSAQSRVKDEEDEPEKEKPGPDERGGHLNISV